MLLKKILITRHGSVLLTRAANPQIEQAAVKPAAACVSQKAPVQKRLVETPNASRKESHFAPS